MALKILQQILDIDNQIKQLEKKISDTKRVLKDYPDNQAAQNAGNELNKETADKIKALREQKLSLQRTPTQAATPTPPTRSATPTGGITKQISSLDDEISRLEANIKDDNLPQLNTGNAAIDKDLKQFSLEERNERLKP